MGFLCCTSRRRRSEAPLLPSFPITIWNSDKVGYCELRFNFMYLPDDEQTITINEFKQMSNELNLPYTMNRLKLQGIIIVKSNDIESLKQMYAEKGLRGLYRDLRTPSSSPK